VTEAETAWKLTLLQEADLERRETSLLPTSSLSSLASWSISSGACEQCQPAPISPTLGGQKCTKDFRHNESRQNIENRCTGRNDSAAVARTTAMVSCIAFASIRISSRERRGHKYRTRALRMSVVEEFTSFLSLSVVAPFASPKWAGAPLHPHRPDQAAFAPPSGEDKASITRVAPRDANSHSSGPKLCSTMKTTDRATGLY